MSIEVGRIGELGQKNTDTEGLYRSACRKRRCKKSATKPVDSLNMEAHGL